jgi:hypothetical protein
MYTFVDGVPYLLISYTNLMLIRDLKIELFIYIRERVFIKLDYIFSKKMI